MVCSMKVCNITSSSLALWVIVLQLRFKEFNISYLRVLFHSYLAVAYILVWQTIKISKEKNMSCPVSYGAIQYVYSKNMVDLFCFLFILPGLYFFILIYDFFLTSVTHEFTPAFSGTRVARYLVFCLVFCRPLFPTNETAQFLSLAMWDILVLIRGWEKNFTLLFP